MLSHGWSPAEQVVRLHDGAGGPWWAGGRERRTGHKSLFVQTCFVSASINHPRLSVCPQHPQPANPHSKQPQTQGDGPSPSPSDKMANPTQQGFFVPDLLAALPNTLASIIDQRVNAIVDQRFQDIEQRLDNVEAVLRAEGRLAPPRQSPLRAQVQHHQQQHHQPQFQHNVNPPPPPQPQTHHNQNVVDNTDPVLALASANQAAAMTAHPAPPVPPQQQQQQQSHQQQQQQAQAQQQQQQQAQQQQQQQQQQQPQMAPPPAAVLHAMPPIVAMEIPPEGFPISSRATMQLELDQFTIPRGYSMRMSGTRDMGKGKRKIRWICFRAGEARYSEASKAAGMPERSSKKCNCPFKFECVETFRDSNMWVVHHHITPGTTTHNHPPSDPSEDPRSRKLPPAVASEVDGWLRQGWQVSKIMTELKNRGFKNVLSRDLYNRRQQLKREDESGEA